MRLRSILLIALLATAARASNVSNEITVNTTQPTDTNPRSGSVGDALSASFDLDPHLALNAGAMLTSQNASPSPVPGESGSAAVALLSLGIEWEVSDSWTLGLSGDWSPQTKQFADAPIAFATQTGTAHIRSLSSEVVAGLDLSYDSPGESALEWSFGGGLHFAHWDIDQTIPLVTDARGVVVNKAQALTEVKTFCSKHTNLKNCGVRIARELGATPFVLNSLELSASVTAVVKADTDVTLSADYYDYIQDATQTGYASLIFNGRGGAGVPVAPLQYMIRPEVAHRFGDFSAKLWVQAGHYVQGAGGTTAGLGIKLQYKFSKTYRMWVRLLGQRDVDDQGGETQSGSFALGAAYRF